MVTKMTQFEPALRIIVVEDYTSLREQLVMHLQADGHSVQGADSGMELDELLQISAVPDILILDLNLPIENGNSIAQRMRRMFPNIGIIMHTVRTSTSEKVHGYQSGADMYVSKPASPAELSAVVCSLGRRLNRTMSSPDWTLDIKKQALISPSNQSITLTAKESLVLSKLAGATEMFMESEQLLILLTSDNSNGKKSSLEILISRLRKKIAPILGSEPSIKSVHGQGYQLCFPLKIERQK